MEKCYHLLSAVALIKRKSVPPCRQGYLGVSVISLLVLFQHYHNNDGPGSTLQLNASLILDQYYYDIRKTPTLGCQIMQDFYCVSQRGDMLLTVPYTVWHLSSFKKKSNIHTNTPMDASGQKRI